MFFKSIHTNMHTHVGAAHSIETVAAIADQQYSDIQESAAYDKIEVGPWLLDGFQFTVSSDSGEEHVTVSKVTEMSHQFLAEKHYIVRSVKVISSGQAPHEIMTGSAGEDLHLLKTLTSGAPGAFAGRRQPRQKALFIFEKPDGARASRRSRHSKGRSSSHNETHHARGDRIRSGGAQVRYSFALGDTVQYEAKHWDKVAGIVLDPSRQRNRLELDAEAVRAISHAYGHREARASSVLRSALCLLRPASISQLPSRPRALPRAPSLPWSPDRYSVSEREV
jgi:hypothetical protein